MQKSETTRAIGKVILLTLAVTGAVVLVTALPGLGYIFKEVNRHRFNKYRAHRLNQTIRRLQKQELISIKEEKDHITIKLLEKGREKILRYKLEEMSLTRTKWDGWWRIITFDIPEYKKNARDFLRMKMKKLGFYMLHKSVLVTPWECRDEVDFIKHFYQVSDYVALIKAKTFDGEDKVKKHFDL